MEHGLTGRERWPYAKRDLLIKAKKEQLEKEYAEWIETQVAEHMSEWEEENPCPSEDDEGINAIFKWEEWREQEEEETEHFYKDKSVEEFEHDMEEYESGLDDYEVEKQYKSYHID